MDYTENFACCDGNPTNNLGQTFPLIKSRWKYCQKRSHQPSDNFKVWITWKKKFCKEVRN